MVDKTNKVLFLLLFFLTINFSIFAYKQTFKVGVNVQGGARVYNVSAGGTKRDVIDLGYFNDNDINKKVYIARVNVEISVSDEEEGDLEITAIKTDKLSFMGFNSGTATYFLSETGKENSDFKLSIENIKIDSDKKTGEINFAGDDKYFKYSFDLIGEVSGIQPENMVGFPIVGKKDGSENVEINLQDLIIAHLRAAQ